MRGKLSPLPTREMADDLLPEKNLRGGTPPRYVFEKVGTELFDHFLQSHNKTVG